MQDAPFLRQFAKTKLLAPGESETLTISFDTNQMASFDDTGVLGEDSVWVMEKGDYKRARIAIQDGFVTTMEILIEEQPIEEAPKPIPASSQDESVRIAFEWVEEHLLELNERCNEIIGQGKNELVLLASELPEEKCWENICKELIRAGLEQINILPGEGIQILLK